MSRNIMVGLRHGQLGHRMRHILNAYVRTLLGSFVELSEPLISSVSTSWTGFGEFGESPAAAAGHGRL